MPHAFTALPFMRIKYRQGAKSRHCPIAHAFASVKVVRCHDIRRNLFRARNSVCAIARILWIVLESWANPIVRLSLGSWLRTRPHGSCCINYQYRLHIRWVERHGSLHKFLHDCYVPVSGYASIICVTVRDSAGFAASSMDLRYCRK